MKLHGIKVSQNGTVFYETAIPAEELADSELFTPDRWSLETAKGYQRDINQRHARQLAKYLADENETNILPNNIIINSRTPLNVTTTRDNVVEIELGRFPLFVVDGQHRIEGIRQAIENGLDLSKYTLGVTLTNFDLKEEMLHFRNINTRIVRPPKALADLIMGRLAEDYGIVPANQEDQSLIRATRVVMALAQDAPWHGLIALGGQQKRNYNLTTQAVMAQTLTPMFNSGRFANPSEDEDHIIQLFKDFWMALSEVFPEAFASPETHMIQRSVGLKMWSQIFSRMLVSYNLNPTKEQMREAIELMAKKMDMTSEFWASKVFYNRMPSRLVGSTAYGNLINMIWQEIPKDPLLKKA